MSDETEKPEISEQDVTSKPDVKASPPENKPVRPSKKKKSRPPRKLRVKHRKGVGFGTVLTMMILATLGGAALSYGFERLHAPNQETVSTSQFEALEAKFNATQKPTDVELAPLISRIEALEARPVISSGVGEPSMTSNTTDLEARVAKLEAQVVPDFAVIDERLSALEGGIDAPSRSDPIALEQSYVALTARLDSLENETNVPELEQRISTLEAAEPAEIDPELLMRLEILESAVQNVPKPTDIAPLETRLASLETAAQDLKDTQADVIKANAPIPPFPSNAVLAALSETDMGSQKGWLGKTFNKYVLADNADAIKAVSGIELLLQQGRVDMAMEQVQALPESGQQAAQAWTDAVNAQRR